MTAWVRISLNTWIRSPILYLLEENKERREKERNKGSTNRPWKPVVLHCLLSILPPTKAIVEYVELASSPEGIPWLPHFLLLLLARVPFVLPWCMGGWNIVPILQSQEDLAVADRVGWREGETWRVERSRRREQDGIVLHTHREKREKEMGMEESMGSWRAREGRRRAGNLYGDSKGVVNGT